MLSVKPLDEDYFVDDPRELMDKPFDFQGLCNKFAGKPLDEDCFVEDPTDLMG